MERKELATVHIKVAIAGREARLASELVSKDTVMPMALVASAMGLSSRWDSLTETLHLASPVHGKVISLGVAGFGHGESFACRVKERLRDRLEGAGARVKELPGAPGDPRIRREDLNLVIAEPIARRGAGASFCVYWGWASPVTSWRWGRRILEVYRSSLGISGEIRRASLTELEGSYPPFMRWGNPPGLVIRPLSVSSLDGVESLDDSYAIACAEALFCSLLSVFRHCLPEPRIPDPDGLPAPVDYASLQQFWAWPEGFDVSEGSDQIPGDAETYDEAQPGPALDSFSEDVDQVPEDEGEETYGEPEPEHPVEEEESNPDDRPEELQSSARRPSREARTFRGRRKPSVREISPASRVMLSPLASAASKKGNRMPALPSHLSRSETFWQKAHRKASPVEKPKP